jgi:hypothetical protein
MIGQVRVVDESANPNRRLQVIAVSSPRNSRRHGQALLRFLLFMAASAACFMSCCRAIIGPLLSSRLFLSLETRNHGLIQPRRQTR